LSKAYREAEQRITHNCIGSYSGTVQTEASPFLPKVSAHCPILAQSHTHAQHTHIDTHTHTRAEAVQLPRLISHTMTQTCWSLAVVLAGASLKTSTPLLHLTHDEGLFDSCCCTCWGPTQNKRTLPTYYICYMMMACLTLAVVLAEAPLKTSAPLLHLLHDEGLFNSTPSGATVDDSTGS
jgi:hypothetical protein